MREIFLKHISTLLKINKIWNEKIMRFSPMDDTALENTMVYESGYCLTLFVIKYKKRFSLPKYLSSLYQSVNMLLLEKDVLADHGAT